MIDRLRFLLDRPLDPLAARAVAVLATAILLGFALFVLGGIEPDRSTPPREQVAPRRSPPRQALSHAPADAPPAPRPTPHRRRQDPQDEPDSVAGRRAARALRSHRALQHIPYRSTELTVDLVGAHGPRAVLRVSAATVREAREKWRRFLRRYDDSGHSYVPLFRGRGGAHG